MDVSAVFPELAWIDNPELRDGVERAWTEAAMRSGVDDLTTVPWFPPVQAELNLPDERLVPHVRDVVALADGMAETLESRGRAEPDRDLVVTGALVHDVSKLAEFDGGGATAIGDLLGHPHFGVAIVDRADLPVEVAHVLLAHTRRTNVEPATLEAEIVRRADEVAASAIRLGALEDLREA